MEKSGIKASFFFTGDFFRQSAWRALVKSLVNEGHYIGAHSDRHLLYCDWKNRDSLFVSKDSFLTDLQKNYAELNRFGIGKKQARFFLPPYEWYNDSIAAWTRQLGLQLVGYTPGTLSHADYTTPDAGNYRTSETIFRSIIDYEKNRSSGLNGFVLLVHVGTDPRRTDKFYHRLPELIEVLLRKGYRFRRIDEIIKAD